MRPRLQILITISFISIYASSSMALVPIGPPRALLGQGERGIGVSYSHESMDLSGDGDYNHQAAGGGWLIQDTDFEIQDLVSDPIFASLHYGILQNCDVFLRIGVANAKDDVEGSTTPPGTPFFNGRDGASLNAGHEFAWGVGTRATFYETENVSWGGSFNMTWVDPKSSSSTIIGNTGEVGNVDLDLKYWEIVVAGGPTINLGGYWIYGGPFLHFVRGDLDIEGRWVDGPTNGLMDGSVDVEEESVIGGHIGAQWNMTENLCWNAEAAFTGDAWGIGISGLWRVN